MTPLPSARAGARGPARPLAAVAALALLTLATPAAADAQSAPVGGVLPSPAFTGKAGPWTWYDPTINDPARVEVGIVGGEPKNLPDQFSPETRTPDQRPGPQMRGDLPGEFAPVMTPEPSTFALLAGAGLVLGAAARRRARRV